MHSLVHAFLTHSPYSQSSRSRFLAIFQFLAPQKLVGGLAPIWVTRWKLNFLPYRLVKVSRKSVQPFPRTVVSYLGLCTIVVAADEKKTKNICKTYTHPRHLAAADA